MDQRPNESKESINDDVSGLICVFYSGNPFSDFAPRSFEIDGTIYSSVEHYFQIQMLRNFGLFKLAMKLSSITDATVFRKILRQNLRSLTQNQIFDERMFAAWRSTNAIKLLRRANRAKFEQNFDLKRNLVETGDRILIFTSKHDRLLGVGMDETAFLDWLRGQTWTMDELLDNFTRHDSLVDGILGQNLLGFCLMDIRAELSGQPSIVTVWRQRGRLDRRGTMAPETETEEDVVTLDDDEDDDGVEEIDRSDQPSTSMGNDEIGGEEDNELTDEHILANLSNAEASIVAEGSMNDDEASTSADPEESPIIIRVPNERRIIYRRPGAESKGESKTVVERPSDAEIEKRRQVLERLKALRFQKPLINPFAEAWGDSPSFGGGILEHPSRPHQSAIQSRPKLKIPRLCDLPPIQAPVFGRRCAIVYPQLEPGEVPPPDFGPQMVSIDDPRAYPNIGPYGRPIDSTGRCCQDPHSGLPSTSQTHGAQWQVVDTPIDPSLNPAEPPDDLWIPSSNPMKEVFESAKVGIKKLIENVKQNQSNNASDLSRLLDLRPPPIQGQPNARKRKCTKTKAAPCYEGVVFNSKNAQMRHVSNRWIKGGRLTTTGKFEECESSDEEDKEIGRTLRQLEAIPAEMDAENESSAKERSSSPVKIHVVYEDTNEYSDYVRWYSMVHGCTPSDEDADEYQRYLRQWYRWYRTAVKFVDIEPLSDHEGEDDDRGTAEATKDMSQEEKAQLLMQQWRWQQLNEWNLKARHQAASTSRSVQETHSDGVSFSGKPMAYGGK